MKVSEKLIVQNEMFSEKKESSGRWWAMLLAIRETVYRGPKKRYTRKKMEWPEFWADTEAELQRQIAKYVGKAKIVDEKEFRILMGWRPSW